jgi:hypothetical protein
VYELREKLVTAYEPDNRLRVPAGNRKHENGKIKRRRNERVRKGGCGLKTWHLIQCCCEAKDMCYTVSSTFCT